MGRKFIIKDGKEIEITDSALDHLIEKASKAPLISFGKVVKYKVGDQIRVGKITGADRAGNILLAKVVNATKAGFQFSSIDCDRVKKENIFEEVSDRIG